MRIVMMGTGPFAVPTLEALARSQHEVALVVTQPPREASGRKAVPPSPMRVAAERLGLPVFDPPSINTDEARARLASQAPDLLVVADYGQILRRETLAVARLGGVNLHGSLLPKYRGAAPINWALYHGERETGVTTIHMTAQLDAGPCLMQARLPIGPRDTAADLEARLATLGAPLVLETIARLAAGKAEPIVQDESQASRAPRLKKSDGLIDWRRSAEAIRNQIRGMAPWPNAYTFWQRPGEAPLRLIVGPAAIEISTAEPNGTGATVKPDDDAPAPGEILEAHGDRLVVATGDGRLAFESVQPAGKRMLSTAEFLRGYPVRPGQRWGDETA